jgi:hypothetical protein
LYIHRSVTLQKTFEMCRYMGTEDFNLMQTPKEIYSEIRVIQFSKIMFAFLII